VILIDAPDFHFRVAKMANKLGIPVFYYISPQVWAWRTSRVHFLRRYVQRVLCILPFEKDFFQSHDVEVDYVGHPLLEQMDLASLDAIAAESRLIGLMPGSRTKEITTLMPEFAGAARIIHQTFPGTEFLIFQAPNIGQSEIRRFWPQDLPCRFVPFARRYAAMKTCWLILTASGTASLECALLEVPALVAYKLSRISYLIGKMVIRVPYISLPNLILGQQGLPEFIQSEASGERMGQAALQWLEHPEQRARVKGRLKVVRDILGPDKASEKTAEVIVRTLPLRRT
jgi:lipid-A-disaccharide synthase